MLIVTGFLTCVGSMINFWFRDHEIRSSRYGVSMKIWWISPMERKKRVLHMRMSMLSVWKKFVLLRKSVQFASIKNTRKSLCFPSMVTCIYLTPKHLLKKFHESFPIVRKMFVLHVNQMAYTQSDVVQTLSYSIHERCKQWKKLHHVTVDVAYDRPVFKAIFSQLARDSGCSCFTTYERINI